MQLAERKNFIYQAAISLILLKIDTENVIFSIRLNEYSTIKVVDAQPFFKYNKPSLYIVFIFLRDGGIEHGRFP